MNTKRFLTSAIALAALSLANSQAANIAQWTFETSIPTTTGPFSPEVGSGSGSLINIGATANTISSPAGNGSAHSFSSNGWDVGDYFQFSVSTVGFSGIGISFDQTGSNTGPRDFSVAYSLDGTTFTPIGSYAITFASWSAVTPNPISSHTYDLSAITALDNASVVYFAVTDTSTVSINGGTVAAAGTDRLDNFTVFSPVPVPEPSTIALAGIGGVAALFALRRRR